MPRMEHVFEQGNATGELAAGRRHDATDELAQVRHIHATGDLMGHSRESHVAFRQVDRCI